MQFDATEALSLRAKNEVALPPAPPRNERSAWGALWRGAVAGGTQFAADAASVLRAAGTAGAIAAEGDAGLVGVLGQDAVRAGADEARQRLQEGTEFDSATARTLRDYERTLRPDPVTATTAENVVYGLTRGLTKAVGAVATAGPVGGAAVFGGSEAAATFDDLRREGVDSATAGKAAAITGVASAAGVVLPMAGSTLARTAALYVAGGPGAFIAQQQGIKTILERSGHIEQAQKFDPFDPLGLTLAALIPLPFAGVGAVRNIRAGRKAAADAPGAPQAADQAPMQAEVAPALSQEAADAAMVHNLTLSRQAADQVPPVAGVAEMFRGPVTENQNFKAWFGESQATKWASGGVPSVKYHGTAQDVAAFDMSLAGSRDGGDFGAAIYVADDPEVASRYATHTGSDPTLGSAAARAIGGNVMPVYIKADRPLILYTSEDFNALWKRAGGEEAWFERTPQQQAEFIQSLGYDSVYDKKYGQWAVFRPEQIKSAIGNSGRFDPNSGSLTDPVPVLTELAPRTPPAQIEAAVKAAEQLQASGKPLDEFVTGANLAPDVQNLLIGMAEAGNDAGRASRMLADFARTVEARPNDAAVDIAADVVEASRRGAEVTPVRSADIAQGPKDPTAASIASRVDELQTSNPDMVVRLDEDGKPVTLAEELAAVRREAAEGTDAELGALDAELVRVATQCALSTGQAM
jgi:hypothetical protein